MTHWIFYLSPIKIKKRFHIQAQRFGSTFSAPFEMAREVHVRRSAILLLVSKFRKDLNNGIHKRKSGDRKNCQNI